MGKQKKNSAKGAKSAHPSRKKIMGADVKNIGAAIAMAVVGEIAQNAISRAVKSAKDSNPADTVHASVPESVQKTASSARSVVDNVIPLKGGSDVVRQVLEEVKPAIADLVQAVIGTTDSAQQAAASTVDQTTTGLHDAVSTTAQAVGDFVQGSMSTAQQASGDMADSVQGSLQNGVVSAADAVKTVMGQVKDPNQKGKKKKKKGKNKK
jgi:uncharacterized protein YukE